MKKLTPTRLRKDLYQVLDQILESGEGVEVERAGGKVLLLPQASDKLSRLRPRDTIVGDPDTLDQIGWADAWQPDFT